MLRNIVIAALLLLSHLAFATSTVDGTNLSGKSLPTTASNALNTHVQEQETNCMIFSGVVMMGLIAFRRQRNS